MIKVRFPSDWLLHHSDNRGRHSANHSLLPDMHLRVPVLHVTKCHDSRLVQNVMGWGGGIIKSGSDFKYFVLTKPLIHFATLDGACSTDMHE